MVGKMKSQNPLDVGSRTAGRRRQIYMQIAVALLIFFSGIIAGSGGTVLWVKDRIAWIRPPHPESMVPDIVEHFRSEFNLTEEQARQLKEVFQQAIETRRSIYDEAAQKFEEHEKTLAAKMKRILSAEQYEQWVRDLAARKERFERFGPRGPRQGGRPGPPGPGPRPFGPEKPGQRRFGPGRWDPNKPGPERRGDVIREPNRAAD